jgi:hypothetical protein
MFAAERVKKWLEPGNELRNCGVKTPLHRDTFKASSTKSLPMCRLGDKPLQIFCIIGTGSVADPGCFIPDPGSDLFLYKGY